MSAPDPEKQEKEDTKSWTRLSIGWRAVTNAESVMVRMSEEERLTYISDQIILRHHYKNEDLRILAMWYVNREYDPMLVKKVNTCESEIMRLRYRCTVLATIGAMGWILLVLLLLARS